MEIPSDIQQRSEVLAKNLTRIHGSGTMKTERSGIILYIPCPHCLKMYGVRELTSCHLAVRLSEWVIQMDNPAEKPKSIATCMKQGHYFNAKTLLGMPPLTTRMPGAKSPQLFKTMGTTTEYKLDVDANGNKIPFSPGQTVSILELEPTHPARWYLENRGYDLPLLKEKFDISFCYEEFPESKENDIFYRRLINGWKDTPQARIVFNCDMDGIRKGWQSRIIDATDASGNYFILSPLTMDWEKVSEGKDKEGNTIYCPPFDEATTKKKWPPSKYRNAKGARRSEILFGFDCFVKNIQEIPRGKRFAVITEGPLDAARFSFYGIPVAGKSISSMQAGRIKEHCDHVVVALDNDVAGRSALNSLMTISASAGLRVSVIHPPKDKKDFGECTDKAAMKILWKTLQQSKQQ